MEREKIYDREIIYEIFTVFGWSTCSFENYRNHKGEKRWRWADAEERRRQAGAEDEE